MITQSYQINNHSSQPNSPKLVQVIDQKSNSYSLLPYQNRQNDFKHLIMQAVQNNDLANIRTLLIQNQNQQITNIVDNRKYTLLHLAAFNNSYTTLIQLIEYQERIKDQKILQKWINTITNDGFTALHFSAYRGNMQMAEYLISKGGNPQILNKQGMNAIHIAAQGDQPSTIVYFRKIGLDTQLRDQKGGTALHWASFYGCEQAVNYLVSFDEVDLNLQDNEGLTALHLSAISGHHRIIKKLLIKGCNKQILDLQNEAASDKAQQNEFKNIERILTEKNNYLVSYLNIKVSYDNLKRSRSQMIRFMLMLGYVVGYQCYLILDNNTMVLICYVGFELVVLTIFILLSNSNPGYIQKNQDSLVNLLKEYECFEICPDCVGVKVQRSKHCDICNQCVKVYDHHCPWVNNCIGSHNHCIFYTFIILMVINIIVLMIHIEEIKNEMSLQQWIIEIILLSFATIICGFFLFPVWLLLVVQTQNLFLNKTTYERYSQSKSESKKKLDQLSSGYKLINCYRICFQNKKNPNLNGNSQWQSLQLYDSLMKQNQIDIIDQ